MLPLGMEMATAYHMVHYRFFDADQSVPAGLTLEALCRSALGTTDVAAASLWERAQDRLFAKDDRQLLLNKVADLSSAVFGELCLLQKQDLQALLELKASKVQLSNITTAEIYNLGERAAPGGSQFVRGIAYWLAIGNHLFFVKTHSMTSDYLREYLGWLLAGCTSTIDQAAIFKLRAEFDRAQIGDDIGEIRSLRLSGKAAPHLAVTSMPPGTPPRTVSSARVVAGKFAEFAQALPAIELLFGKSKTESLVKSLGAAEYLTLDATVKVVGRRTAESRARFRDIANDLADMTEAKVQIEGKDGKVSDGDAILRTRMPFNLPTEGSNLLEFDNVADQLQEVYARFVKDGKITA
jgi:hypothetical protein